MSHTAPRPKIARQAGPLAPRWAVRTMILPATMWAGVSVTLWAADGIIYFNRIPGFISPVTLHRANADGSGEQFVPVPLPAAFNPSVSRDGAWVLLTSGDPGRPFKLSNNVFAFNVANGGVTKLTGFEDIVRYDNFVLTNDAGGTNIVGDRSARGYSINFPFHKAPSPDGTRVVTVNLQRVGTSTTDVPRTNSIFNGLELTLGSYRAPIVEIFTAGDPAPFGQALHLGAERTGFNQGGDGVDWHPTREEIVVSLRSDIPATSNTGVNVAEGTVIAVFASGGIAPFLRKLTSPVGNWFSYVDLFTSYLTSFAQHDYAPAISPDGTRVAYARHTQRIDTRISLGPLPAQCEIRVINYDGTGDHSVLQFAEGVWVDHLSWSPDGTAIAFDVSPQVIVNGWPSVFGDATRSEIHVMGAEGSNPHRVVDAPASHPSWAPGQLPGVAPIQLRLERGADGSPLLRAVGGTPGEELAVEGSDDLATWNRVSDLQQSPTGAAFAFPVEPGVRARFFRIVRAEP